MLHIKRLLMSRPGRGLVAAAAAGAPALANAAPAAAALPGAGEFTGWEEAPPSELYGFPPIINGPPNVLCAEFDASATTPLVITMNLTGTFNGFTIAPPGVAVFESTTPYDASPLGTFASGSLCLGLPFSVPGDLTVDVTGDSCEGEATYTRIQSAIVIESTSLNCAAAGSASMVLTGVQVPTSLLPEPVTGPSSIVAGTYVQA